MARVLVVDGNVRDATELSRMLARAGHETNIAESGGEALLRLANGDYDLLTIEWMLADMTALELTEAIRRRATHNPVHALIISDFADAENKARALESGVDDFVAKSDADLEIVARVNAALRRPPAVVTNWVVRVGPVLIDKMAHKVVVNELEISLAPVEYRLMEFFLENSGRVLDRKYLLEKVWERRGGIGERTVDVHVRRLRAALEPHKCEHLLQTVRGFGYRFG